MNNERFLWWNSLRHGGLLLDAPRLNNLIPQDPQALPFYTLEKMRKELATFRDNPKEKRGHFIGFVLDTICGFNASNGAWYRAGNVSRSYSRTMITGDTQKPDHLWLGTNNAYLPVFISQDVRLGLGRGKKIISQTLQWLRQGSEQLAVITNGFQWRLVFAGMDYDAFSEWDIDQWLSEGTETPELIGFRSLFNPILWTPPKEEQACPLISAINDSRKGQSDLSQTLGESVRQAVELLIRAHTPALSQYDGDIESQDIYRAGVRVIMRLVITLFAESREGLLPKDNPVYHNSYSLAGLRDMLDKASQHRLKTSYSTYPRICSLFRLIQKGCSHEQIPVPTYGGELFAPGQIDSKDGLSKALYVFENGCFENDIMTDYQVREILNLLTRTRVSIRQGRSNTWIQMPVDFSSLGSEYIGILYEGLLDFELKKAPQDQPIIFLAVGNQPALPLTTLEQMDDKAIKNLLEKMKDTSSKDDSEGEEEEAEAVEEESEEDTVQESEEEEIAETPVQEQETQQDDIRYTIRTRAIQWAIKACEVGNLLKKPKGKMTPEKKLQYEKTLENKAQQLITRVVMPNERYLIRWGGTRKGAGTFYTRPQLAIPTVRRTLFPLVYDPPLGTDGKSNNEAPNQEWKPKKPEQILELKVCDPACGSGSFLLGSLRFLTNALYDSLFCHNRIKDYSDYSLVELIYDKKQESLLAKEDLPCRPDDENFEVRTKAKLRRYVVERCIYGVDLDPLAIELCRLSLWIETLDRYLPFTFLDHKIKCGNSLVGAWFDQFMHYPVMAWEREGGDKNHTNGVHFQKELSTKAIKDIKTKKVKPEIIQFIDRAKLLFKFDLTDVKTVHDKAEKALQKIHELGIHLIEERAEAYNSIRQSDDFKKLKDAFDLWCALWFWPADQIDDAPLPFDFSIPSEKAYEIVRQVAVQRRFFHWELEFPDVFNLNNDGFDVMLGNPPWNAEKPLSKEFFSSFDPLYRSYGKQEAINKQKEYFQQEKIIEYRWLDYNAYFKAMSNWIKYAGFPFGYCEFDNPAISPIDYLKLSGSGYSSIDRHQRWKLKREETSGYADPGHAFRHQGGGDNNLYKMFLEQAHALLKPDGRFGIIVPSGVYSDYGTIPLRTLFIDKCRWQWLFGFENRDKIFDIDSRQKFNPVIIQKNGQTKAIHTAFMRRTLSDWEKAEQFATNYSREQVVQFSPKSKAILEIQSARDLEVLTKIYSNSVLLGDYSEEGWGIKYSTEFHMTNDSKFFPPRTKWEEWGYRPDEYSRWIKGPWKPIGSLLEQLGVKPLPQGKNPCAQPPYDKLPIPRADIPAGIILSREADAWIREDEIPVITFADASGKPLKIKTGRGRDSEEQEVKGPAIALPLYQGLMFYDMCPNVRSYVSGAGHSAVWEPAENVEYLRTQFLLSQAVYCLSETSVRGLKLSFRSLSNSTNERTIVCSLIDDFPCGHSINHVNPFYVKDKITGAAIAGSLVYDWQMRNRIVGTNVTWNFLSESCWPKPSDTVDRLISLLIYGLMFSGKHHAPLWLFIEKMVSRAIWHSLWVRSYYQSLRFKCILNSIVASLFRINTNNYWWILEGCDYPVKDIKSNSSKYNTKGFWRIDKDKHPEHRLTVLSYVAFCDLQKKIEQAGGNVEKGIEAFCTQNNGEGWMLPETLRLADYGLGHDDRAKEHQPVREYFGPRFYDWQLAQSPEESWKECHLHARNLLGEKGYQALLKELEGGEKEQDENPATEMKIDKNAKGKKKSDTLLPQGKPFKKGKDDLPLFDV